MLCRPGWNSELKVHHRKQCRDSLTAEFNPKPCFSHHGSLCRRNTSKTVGFRGCTQMGFLVLLIKTRLVPSVTMALPGSMKSHTLANPASFISLILRANLWVLPDSALLWYWGQNLGPWTCLARTLSLGYSPSPDLFHLSSKRKSFAFSSDKDLLLPGYDRLSSRQCCYFSSPLWFSSFSHSWKAQLPPPHTPS